MRGTVIRAGAIFVGLGSDRENDIAHGVMVEIPREVLRDAPALLYRDVEIKVVPPEQGALYYCNHTTNGEDRRCTKCGQLIPERSGS